MSSPADSTSLRGVLAALRRRLARDEAVALAIVVATDGSTYRKPGALALVGADGARDGVISGGCLEPELDRLGATVLREDRARSITFDTQGDDDLLFGSGSGCRGRMVVAAFPLRASRDRATIDALLALDDATAPLAAEVTLESDAVTHARLGDRVLVDARGGARGDTARDAGTRAGATLRFRIAPPPRVLLIGAGPEAPPLARLARLFGWQLAVADHRAALADAARLPEADRVLVARAADALARWTDAFDAAIVMTHSASADLEALRALAAHPVPYVGLLGPPRRRDELLAQLDDDTRRALARRLRAPVGIALGGEGPESIALSIAADLQQTFHPRSGASASDPPAR